MQKYIVDGNLKHDSQSYVTGDVIYLEETQAEQLLAIGRVKPAVEDITPPEAPAEPDGFPQRDIPAAPTSQPSLAVPSAPAQPAVPQIDLQQPKQPTPEQIAKDMAQL
jgi:hypothetical protein